MRAFLTSSSSSCPEDSGSLKALNCGLHRSPQHALPRSDRRFRPFLEPRTLPVCVLPVLWQGGRGGNGSRARVVARWPRATSTASADSVGWLSAAAVPGWHCTCLQLHCREEQLMQRSRLSSMAQSAKSGARPGRGVADDGEAELLAILNFQGDLELLVRKGHVREPRNCLSWSAL